MSSKDKGKAAEKSLGSGVLGLMKFLALAALALSAYLASVSLQGGSVAGCGPESSCDKVLHSRWSSWFGLPISLGAAALYVMIFILLWRLGPKVPAVQQRKAWKLLFPGAIAILGAAVWFSALQV
ncbi:MAG TPA: vitamin K epoxide reductase family protein, partial [Verrucomicrobiae bacterium]